MRSRRIIVDAAAVVREFCPYMRGKRRVAAGSTKMYCGGDDFLSIRAPYPHLSSALRRLETRISLAIQGRKLQRKKARKGRRAPCWRLRRCARPASAPVLRIKPTRIDIGVRSRRSSAVNEKRSRVSGGQTGEAALVHRGRDAAEPMLQKGVGQQRRGRAVAADERRDAEVERAREGRVLHARTAISDEQGRKAEANGKEGRTRRCIPEVAEGGRKARSYGYLDSRAALHTPTRFAPRRGEGKGRGMWCARGHTAPWPAIFRLRNRLLAMHPWSRSSYSDSENFRLLKSGALLLPWWSRYVAWRASASRSFLDGKSPRHALILLVLSQYCLPLPHLLPASLLLLAARALHAIQPSVPSQSHPATRILHPGRGTVHPWQLTKRQYDYLFGNTWHYVIQPHSSFRAREGLCYTQGGHCDEKLHLCLRR
ncbi:hypothetical protein K438DRAFT_2114045 [Mycena galopus ATCC 62051]|nr:hypothetical protein K438DRAFT_2114045 [Mycena galopus ATCC 62051]